MPSPAARLASPETGRDWLVAALGAALTAAAVGHFSTHSHSDPLVVVATAMPAAALLAYGGWFWRFGPRGTRGDVVFAWAVAGAGAVLVLDLWAITVDAYGTGAAIDHVFIQHTSIGALGTAIAGTYSERDRRQSRAHDRLRRALDAATDGVAVLDVDGQVEYANAAFRRDASVDAPAAVVGTHWSTYYPDESEMRLADVLDSLADERREHWHGRVVARREDGRTYPQEVSVTSLGEDGYVWVSRDVTGRKERDQRLRVLNRVLRHNVRNALNVVLGRAERLEERLGEDDDCEGIVTAAEDLLAVSEKARVVERVLAEDDAVDADLDGLVAAEVDHVRSNHPQVGFDVVTTVDARVDARIRLALRELLVNAVEHNDARSPRVVVEATRADTPVVRVSDNGSGIPDHEQRALEGTEEMPLHHGSGIGLWVVYWLAQHCGATVEVTDGSTIALHVPAVGTGA